MEELKNVTHVENVRLSENGHSIVILDQSALPNRTEYLTLSTLKEFYDAIFTLKVRGAPCIGIFAGYAMAVLAGHVAYEMAPKIKDPHEFSKPDFESFYGRISALGEELNSSRPTAVNLSYAIKRMLRTAKEAYEKTADPM